MAPISRLARNLPRAFVSGLWRLGAGRLPERPWISYDAQREIDLFLASRPFPRVLEFGSGQSTRWYARRCADIVSLEADPIWYARIQPQLSGISGIDYRLASNREEFAFPKVDGRFDLVMIDGPWRDDCVDFAIERAASGAIIYLDNSDKSANPSEGDVPAARRRLIEFAQETGSEWREFTDFAPAQFFAQRGLLIRTPLS